MNEKRIKIQKTGICVQKLEIIAGHQITGYGTCDCKWIFGGRDQCGDSYIRHEQ